jgi:hypothetical protein
MKRQPSTFKLWLASCFVSVVMVGLVYVTVQQNYRQSTNDPQIQLAEDTSAALNAGASPASLVASQGATVQMEQSLAPFVTIVGSNRHVLASSGELNGHVLLPPPGAFAAADTNRGKNAITPGQNNITWQPKPGIREAAVITTYNGGYVVAARSLREVEARESQLELTCAVTLAVLLVGLSGLFFWL